MTVTCPLCGTDAWLSLMHVECATHPTCPNFRAPPEPQLEIVPVTNPVLDEDTWPGIGPIYWPIP